MHTVIRKKKLKFDFFYNFSLEEFYTVGDPVYARDLWLVVELASDNRFFKLFQFLVDIS